MAEDKSSKAKKFIAKFMKWVGKIGGDNTLYRGLADESWEVKVSLYRRLCPKGVSATKEQFIQASKELVEQARQRGHARDHVGGLHDLQIMAKLQHHGAATCLIDFTKNPLVALWFACRQPTNQSDKDAGKDADGKVVAIVGNPAKYKTIESNDCKLPLEDLLGVKHRWKWQPENLDNRVIAQHSEFIFGAPVVESDEEIIIFNDDKEAILRELAKYNISEEHLFSDFYGFAQINAHDRPYYRKSAAHYASLAEKAAEANNYLRAIDWYDIAIAKDPKNSVWFNNRGNIKRLADDSQGAIADYDRAIELNPQDADAYYNRGLANYELDNYENAIANYDRAIDINPQDAAAYNNRGLAKDELGDHENAIADYDRAIDINPQYANTYYNRGISKNELGDYKGAIADYDQAIDINPQDAVAYYNRGYAKDEFGDYKGAIADYDRAIDINPQDAAAYNNRGIIRRKLGDSKGAIADYDRAIDINPQDAAAYNNRGIANSKLGHYGDAIADYDRAIDINPQYATAYNNRGNTKNELGDKEGAKADLQKAKELRRNSPQPKKK